MTDDELQREIQAICNLFAGREFSDCMEVLCGVIHTIVRSTEGGDHQQLLGTILHYIATAPVYPTKMPGPN
jgi:hypothetical protein